MQKEIFDAIKTYETIIIHRHVRPDPDAIGSQCGLKEMLKLSFPDKAVYAVGKEDASLNFLSQMDVVADSVYERALVIVCDTANTGRICDERYGQGDKLIKIDHHPNNDVYGEVNWVDTSASSTSELIYEFYHLFSDELQMDGEIARLLYAGIVGDTGRFLFPSTTNKTFRYAAELIEYSFDRQAVYDGLYMTSRHIAKLRGYVLEHHTLSDAGLSTVTLTKQLMQYYNVNPVDTSKVVGTLGDIEGIKVWVLFIEEDDQIRVRLRSKGVVINKVAEKYNGGGHPFASGASVDTWGEVDQVINDLERLCQVAED